MNEEEISNMLRTWYVNNKTELEMKHKSLKERNNRRYPSFVKELEARIKKENTHVE